MLCAAGRPALGHGPRASAEPQGPRQRNIIPGAMALLMLHMLGLAPYIKSLAKLLLLGPSGPCLCPAQGRILQLFLVLK